MTKIPSSPDNRIFWIVSACLVVFVYFFALNVPLLGPDEPRYAQVAREMFERGDWTTPTLGGFKWFEKPALLYWLQIASYHIFGVSEFAARFGSALFGLGTILALWLLGRNWERDRREDGTAEERRHDFANWLVLIAASSFGLVAFARGASFDIILTFPISAALVCFYIFDQRVEVLKRDNNETEGSPSGLYLPLSGFYFFIGLALLAKGLVGIIFPLAIVCFYFLLSRRLPGKTFLFSILWGTLLTSAVAAVWYLPVYLQNGWQFVDEFFIQHHFQRYTSNKYLHPQPFHFFFWVLPLMTLPWLPFFFAAVWNLAKRAIAVRPIVNGDDNSASQSTAISPLETFAAAWLLVPLVFFSFSGSKLPGYIMPALPPALVLTAVYLRRLMDRKIKAVKGFKALAMTTLAVIVGILAFALPHFADMDSVKGLLAAAADRGYGNERLFGFITVSHNAEFYAPGRLLRDADGKQKRLINTGEVLAELTKTDTKSALVIVPLEHLRHIVDSPVLVAEMIRDNGEYAILHVRPR